MKPMKREFNGIFAGHIVGFIDKKQAMGYDYREGAYILSSFEKFCVKHFPEASVLNREITLKWAEKRAAEKSRCQLNRVSVIREFARYMNSIGIPAYVIPPGYHKKNQANERPVPHIYTKDELTAIFSAADKYRYQGKSRARHLVIPVIFRLMYCCGLRPVEARRLRIEDVNLISGSISIIESKGHKDRIVVMSDDMLELVRKYDAKVEQVYPGREYFFQGRAGKMYSQSWSTDSFRELLTSSGLYKKDGRNPREYDLRHTYATHRLYKWLQDGENINACLPYLSEYMGHAKLSSTAYYIHLVPEFYPKMMELGLESPVNIIPDIPL
jgi:integrase